MLDPTTEFQIPILQSQNQTYNLFRLLCSTLNSWIGEFVFWCHEQVTYVFAIYSKTNSFSFFSGAIREEVKSKAGFNVDLPCVINQAECGDFHSIKWYKENRRVYVYSPIANFAKGQLIWKCPFVVFKYSKKPTNILPVFLP